MKIQKERIHRLTIPSYMALNAYIQIAELTNKSERQVPVEIHSPVQARDLPKHLGNNINTYA